ncbi:conjugal transfer protein TraF [Litorivivens sp.]|uniref:conjugal transfer protein TraF n=1 Tax=Litorivivens sp. TaxID=2020868 RepID=UPI0035623F3C
MATFHLFSRWRKKSLAIVLTSFAQSLYAQQTIVDTELLGLASQTDASSFIANPATMHLKNERYRYSLNSATGGYFNDKNGLLDDFEDAEEEGERIRELSNERLLFPSDFERQIAIFERMDGKLFTLSGGNVAAVALPIDGVETTLVSTVVSRLATAFDYNPNDAQRLRTAPILGVVSPPDLESRIIIQGIAISDVGVNFSKTLTNFYDTRVGVTLKYQGVRLLEKAIEIDDYEEITLDEFRDALKTRHHLNADIGVYKAWKQWHGSFVVKSLNSKSYKGSNGNVYRQHPGVLLGLAWQGERTLASLDWDVVPSQRRFGRLDDEQRVRLSGQYKINRRWNISAGIAAIVEGRDNDALSLGAGYHWESGAAVNMALIYAGPEELGGSIQVRFPFWKRD